MAKFRIKHRARIDDAVLRVVRAQLGDAVRAAEDDSTNDAERVHKVRTRLKRSRAALALIRKRAGKRADRDAAHLRDAGRKLAAARDLAVLADTFHALATDAGPALAATLARAEARTRDELAEADVPRTLRKSAHRLRKLRRKAGAWPIESKRKRRRAAAEAIAKTWRRADRARRHAREKPTEVRFHDWRKRVKALSYQLRLLGGPRAPRLQDIEKLAEMLGQIHDLDRAGAAVARRPELFGEHARSARSLLAERRATLASDAFALADELFSEKPG
jgi:CHAD domain-containing protein